jgi:lysophospholipase
LRAPVLIVAAGLDQVVDTEAIREFARRVPGVSLVFIREAMHEILTEGDAVRGQFLAAFDAFIEGKGVP